MTTIQWVQENLEIEFSAYQNLGEIIHAIELQVASRGEVLCEVSVNGKTYTEKEEKLLGSQPRCEIKLLQIKTERPDQLIVQARASVLQYIPLMGRLTEDCADSIRTEGIQVSGQKLNELIDGCLWIIETLSQIRSAARTIGRKIQSPERWYEAEKQLASTVRQVTEALEKGDQIQMADIMEYELTTSLQLWSEVLTGELVE